MPEFTDHISEVVSEGSVHLEHSDCLKIHDSTCSWQQYYPVLSFLMTGNLHSDYERVGGLLGFPACSSIQWSRIAFPALFEHQEQFLQLVKKNMKIIMIKINIHFFQYNCCNIFSRELSSPCLWYCHSF